MQMYLPVFVVERIFIDSCINSYATIIERLVFDNGNSDGPVGIYKHKPSLHFIEGSGINERIDKLPETWQTSIDSLDVGPIENEIVWIAYLIPAGFKVYGEWSI